MSIEIKVPELPESVSEATVGEWHKNQGDGVSRDENVVDLETDKVMLEVPATDNGVLAEIRVQEGTTVGAGDVLAVLEEGEAPDASGSDDGGTEASGSQAEPASESEAEPQPQAESGDEESDTDVASPAARKLMDERGLSAGDITGSGKDGRITKPDVLAAAEASQGGDASATPQSGGGDSEAADEKADRAALASADGDRAEQRVPMTRIRSRIAERLLDASQNTAMLTTFNEVDLQAVTDLRKRYKEQFQEEHDVRLGFMSFFVKATVEALKRFPVVNASIDESDVVYHGYYDIGIAVSSPRGLLVPVLRNADQLSYAGVEGQIRDFGKRSQEGKITMDELTGGTFTITNGGAFGSLLSTPIINPPQGAILGMHGINEKPVVVDGEIVIRPMMYLAVSYDHRLIDGRDSVLFLKTVKELLEDPARLLLQL